jgi:hypothetical protein
LSARRVACALTLSVALLGSAVTRADQPSLIAPPRPRSMTRVYGTVRPFANLAGNGGAGLLADAGVERWFEAPLKLGLALSPGALAVDRYGTGVIAHLRGSVGYETDLIGVELWFGSRTQNFGAGGLSFGSAVRLGAFDGLNAQIGFGYAIVRNRYTDKIGTSLSDIRGVVEVPLSRRVKLFAEAGYGVDAWLLGTIGLRHAFAETWAARGWSAGAGVGVAWMVDRFACQYRAGTPCGQQSVTGMGPTVTFSLERRF